MAHLALAQVEDTWHLFLGALLLFGAIAHFAVAWHRFIILGERKPNIFRFGRYELIYSIFLLIAGPGLSLFSLVIEALPQNDGAQSIAVVLIALLFVILAIGVLMPFFGIVAPFIAIGEFTFSFGFFWKLLEHNRLRYLGVLVLTEVIFSAGIWITSIISDALTSSVLAPLLDLEGPTPDNMDPLLMAGLYLPSSVLYGVFITCLVSFSIGVLSISYCRLALIRDE